MTEQMENILDDCLESVLAGRESIDSCCARYPNLEEQLRPLLDVALLSRAALEVDVPSAARAATREKVMAAARGTVSAAGSAGRSRGFIRGSLLHPVALGAGLIFLLSATTAMAATGAAPDSFLYPLEQRLEDARTALTPGALDKARVEVGHANERLDEMENMVGKDKPEYLPELLTRFDAHLDNATRLVENAAGKGEDTAEVEQLIESTRGRLDKIAGEINDSVPDEFRDSVGEAGNRSDHDAFGPMSGTSGGYGMDAGSISLPGGSDGVADSGDTAGNSGSPATGSPGEPSEPSHEEPPHSEPPHEDSPDEDELDEDEHEIDEHDLEDLHHSAVPSMEVAVPVGAIPHD